MERRTINIAELHRRNAAGEDLITRGTIKPTDTLWIYDEGGQMYLEGKRR